MPQSRKNYDSAVTMYAGGDSIGVIADCHGISRQAMHKILARRGVQFRPHLRYGEENHFYRSGHPQDERVHSITTQAIQNGELLPEPCESCGHSGTSEDGRNEVHAHHDDYNKPLDVRWLCKDCHHEWHKTNEPVRRTVDLPNMERQDIASKGGKSSWEKNHQLNLENLEQARKARWG